jgi:class 3 adenylate cyclase
MLEETTGCILVADVSDTSKLSNTVGDTAAHQALDLCVKLLSALTEQHGGRVVKATDDEVLSLFPDASRAGAAARDIQLGLREMAPVDKVRLSARIGLNFGPLVERDGDVFGDTVSFASQLTEIARRGQIVASLDTVQLLAPMQKMDCRRLFSIPVKGREKEVDICELMWTDTDDATQVVAQHATTDSGDQLRLVHRTRVVVLTRERDSLVLGRDAAADLVVADRMASRAHCRIERRQDEFVLADSSVNGTYLSIDGEREIVLRNEEAQLRRHGFITLGQSRAAASEFVEFFCE